MENTKKDKGIKFARPFREEDKIKCIPDYNYIRTTRNEIPSENYINMKEPNKSDYAYETLKLLLIRKLSQRKGEKGEVFNIIKALDSLMEEIYTQEIESSDDIHQLSNVDNEIYYKKGKKIINAINEIFKGDLYE